MSPRGAVTTLALACALGSSGCRMLWANTVGALFATSLPTDVAPAPKDAGEPCGGCVDGQALCQRCSGRGITTCATCAGRRVRVLQLEPWSPCPFCEGDPLRQAKEACLQCGGTGRTGPFPNRVTLDCKDCSKTGRVVCPTCHGTKVVGTCPRCRGSGRVYVEVRALPALAARVGRSGDACVLLDAPPRSVAERFGLLPGDVIVRVNESVIESPADATAALACTDPSDSDRFRVTIARLGLEDEIVLPVRALVRPVSALPRPK